jgi:integrase
VGQVKSGTNAGNPCARFHAVGGVPGLLLQCSPPKGDSDTGARSWILRTMVGSKRRDMGLGGYPGVTLAMARDSARKHKELIRQSIDPILEKRSAKSRLIMEQGKAVTFEMLSKEYIEKKSKEFKTAKQTQKLTNHLINYAYPFIGRMVVADIERAHIIKMLEAIWETKTETASRVRLHVERIIDLSIVKGLRTGANPARWKGNLDMSLPAPSRIAKPVHYAALPVDQIHGFLLKLQAQDWIGAKALLLIIFTAARSGEVRGATWAEIDFESKLWTIPEDRMKSGKAHTVPLSESAVELLKSLPHTGKHIFNNSRGNSLSDATISKAPKRIGYDVTAHGFRSTFKDWARKYTGYADEISELALAHVNDDKTRAAYARDELIDKRRLLMADWDRFCHQAPVSGDILTLGTKKRA